ncbi:MAG: undecaprenyldiphospho-muramoylpentapeptide beta-N-acetylglucosaminyltransferase [Treponema sp.]|jgi:UDP-N-acetylglucosamine--N-acetylmuramyl-(pentapeptide) pyrophosphoryl-undecaprenol N-acetylglucosamine transferase|nr:undecaprenyldiphospho-muramoylpentapeptide beta-N-acetylglucosaminyltransferase [Treponema sp.]
MLYLSAFLIYRADPRIAKSPNILYVYLMVSIAFAGGGTGGHIYPGLAVAAALKERFPCRIFWIGSNGGMDRSLVEREGLEFFGVPAGKLRRYLSPKNLSDLFKVGAGFWAARGILKRERPALLFSKGGFVSVPPCAAAASLGIPVFTHESDYSPGLATRINARFASRIFVAYGDTAGFFPRALRRKVSVAGNPVRPAFRNADPASGRAFLGAGPEERILLVLGGSQGAREINEVVRKTLPTLARHYIVAHQVGPNQDWDLGASERYRPYAYLQEEMPQVMAAAELVLGRSGAGAVWEAAAVGKPMALVPLRGSGTRGDQAENAAFFERAGAAVVVDGGGSPEETAAAVARTVCELAENAERRSAMAAAAAALGRIDGADLLARAIQAEVAGGA